MNGCPTSGMDHVNSRIWDILMSDDMKARIAGSIPPLPAQLEYFFVTAWLNMLFFGLSSVAITCKSSLHIL